METDILSRFSGIFHQTLRALFSVLRITFAARTPFFDYDCTSVQDPLIDYGELHYGAMATVHQAERKAAAPGPPPHSGRLLVNHADRMRQECPLGLLYVAITHYYSSLEEPQQRPDRDIMLEHSNKLVQLASEGFPIHTICTSRWPIFETMMLRLTPSFGSGSGLFFPKWVPSTRRD